MSGSGIGEKGVVADGNGDEEGKKDPPNGITLIVSDRGEPIEIRDEGEPGVRSDSEKRRTRSA